MSITSSLGLPEGCSAMNFTFLDSVTNKVRVIRKLADKLNIFNFGLDTQSKVFLADSESVTLDDKHVIQDMDFTKHLIASATSEGGVKLRVQKNINAEPFFINAGSKSVKTYKAHPTKPGVSMVQIA